MGPRTAIPVVRGAHATALAAFPGAAWACQRHIASVHWGVLPTMRTTAARQTARGCRPGAGDEQVASVHLTTVQRATRRLAALTSAQASHAEPANLFPVAPEVRGSGPGPPIVTIITSLIVLASNWTSMVMSRWLQELLLGGVLRSAAAFAATLGSFFIDVHNGALTSDGHVRVIGETPSGTPCASPPAMLMATHPSDPRDPADEVAPTSRGESILTGQCVQHGSVVGTSAAARREPTARVLYSVSACSAATALSSMRLHAAGVPPRPYLFPRAGLGRLPASLANGVMRGD
jgi:hypothetical protein